MSRLFFIIAIALVVYLVVKAYRKNVPQQDKALTEDMVRCEYCGVHLPKSEGIMAEGRFFCGAEHRNAYHK